MGFEQPAYSSGNTGGDEKSDAQTGALSDDFIQGGALPAFADPDLQAVVNAWPSLSVETQQSILAIVRREEHQ
jgi:hypothetical protein